MGIILIREIPEENFALCGSETPIDAGDTIIPPNILTGQLWDWPTDAAFATVGFQLVNPVQKSYLRLNFDRSGEIWIQPESGNQCYNRATVIWQYQGSFAWTLINNITGQFVEPSEDEGFRVVPAQNGSLVVRPIGTDRRDPPLLARPVSINTENLPIC